jgi:hypothetical protein
MPPASAATSDAALPSIGSEELAEGLMLVRASTLKIIRLQLAMERRDQRVALEAVDDLVALDRCLQEFLTHYPNPHEGGLLSSVLELERSALNVEKHTLAAGFSSGGWHAETAAGQQGLADEDPMAPPAPQEIEPYEFRLPLWVRGAALVLLLVAAACAAYVLDAAGAISGIL